jgi:hypothetical protein
MGGEAPPLLRYGKVRAATWSKSIASALALKTRKKKLRFYALLLFILMSGSQAHGTLAQSPRFAFNAAIAHRRDSGGASSVTSRILSLGIAQTKRRNRSRPCHRLLAATCFTTRFAWR